MNTVNKLISATLNNDNVSVFSPDHFPSRLNHSQTMKNANILKIIPPSPQQHQRNTRFLTKIIQSKNETFSESGQIYSPSDDNPMEKLLSSSQMMNQNRRTNSDKKSEIQKNQQSYICSSIQNQNLSFQTQNHQQNHFRRMEGIGISDTELDDLIGTDSDDSFFEDLFEVNVHQNKSNKKYINKSV